MNKYYFDNFEFFFHKTALITNDNKKISYKELNNKIHYLKDYINPRDVVFLVCDNNFQFIYSYYALLRYRAIVFLINKDCSDKQMINLIDIYKPSLIFDSNNSRKMDIKNFSESYFKDGLKIWKKKWIYSIKFDPEIAQLLSTSGTLGSSKFVKQSYQNITTNVADISHFLKIKSTDSAITTMPSHYTYGLSIINTHIYSGGTIILNNNSLFEKIFWKTMNKYKVTNFGGVPFIYEILKKINFHKIKLPYLKYLTVAGGKLDDELIKYFYEILKKKKKKFFVMYGQTEATSRISILAHNRIKNKLGSVGKPIGNYKVSIKNKLNKSEKNGELICKGNNIMIGYANKLNDLKKIDKINYLNTGDIGFKDKDGFLYLTGRINRIFKMYGVRINLDELQNNLNKKNYKCICVSTEKKIVIFIKDLRKERSIANFLNKDYHIKKNILEFKKLLKIPRNNTGKIIYSKLI